MAAPTQQSKPETSWLAAYPALRDKLAKIGIRRPADLVTHLPLRYEDHTRLTPLADIVPGVACQIEGTVTSTKVHFRPRRQLVTELEQGASQVVLRFLNFYPSQQKTLAVGRRIRAFGEARPGFFGIEMIHPVFSVVGEGEPLPDALTPVYPTTAGLAQSALRKMVARQIERDSPLLADTLPPALLEKLKLPRFGDAVRLLHQPGPEISASALEERTHPAWTRLKFDELLAQQLSLKRHRRERQTRISPALNGNGKLAGALLAQVGFRLTGAQSRAWKVIEADLRRKVPMHRLLQGDVGSGKTVVAALAALTAVDAGYQAVFMAPTEILAEQHFRKLALWCEALGVRIAWLAGGQSARQRRDALAACASGDARIVIGTHALFQSTVVLAKLGLAIVDEQHRFGVAQRLALRGKGGGTSRGKMIEPHQLMLSATPIPRTLAMSYFADLDVSVIDELPPGRTPVTTKLVAQRRRPEVVERVRAACASGRQVYWVCPLIEESEKLQLKTALETHAALSLALPEFTVALLHGRMKADEKARVMAALVAGEIDVLVATTVIEVGVDIPNASLMVIEHAERFGLAQLHQLRGRVGRGAAESMCVLLYEERLNPVAKARLKVIFETTDGFEIARQDLLIRGPGELLGARQSGVPLLRFADLEKDAQLLEIARDVAEELLRDAPEIVDAHLDRWFGGREDFIRA